MKKIFILLFISAPGYPACSVADALTTLRPTAEWTMRGTDYASLQWADAVQVKPTLAEVQTAQQACLDTLTPAGILTGQRNSAINQLLTDPSPQGKLFRAILLVELDEVNTIRALLVPTAPARTINQFKTAVQSKINSGAAD